MTQKNFPMGTNDTDNQYRRIIQDSTNQTDQINQKQGKSGRSISLVANYVKILTKPKCKNLFYYK